MAVGTWPWCQVHQHEHMVDAFGKAIVVLLHGSIDTRPWCQVPEHERMAEHDQVVDALDKAMVVLLHETHRGAIDLYCFLCKKVAMPQPSTKLLETGFTLTVCCEPEQILLEQICPTMFGCRYHDS